MMAPENIPMDALLPHRPPMRALDRLIVWSPQGSCARVLLDGEAPWFEDGRFRAIACVELMAQGVAAGIGYAAMRTGSEGTCAGMLVGIDEVTLAAACARLQPGMELRVESHLDHDIPPVTEHTARLISGSEVVAHGRLRVLVGAVPGPIRAETPRLDGFQGCAVRLVRGAPDAIVEIDVGIGHPYLDGHFPGMPLLPAIGQLRLVEHGASLALGRACELEEIERARFQEPVRPGDRIEVCLELAQAPRIRWMLRRGAVPIARGSGRFTESSWMRQRA